MSGEDGGGPGSREPAQPGRTGESTGIATRLGRFALRPARAAARTGKDALTDEVERAIDGALAGPLPEAVARSVVQHQVAERILPELLGEAGGDGARGLSGDQLELLLERVLGSPALERWLLGAGTRLAEATVEGVVRSPAFRQSLMEILESPEFRHVFTRQTGGFGSELAGAARERGKRLDTAIERPARRLLRRKTPAEVRCAGVGTRACGLAVDVVLAQVAFLLLGAMVGLVASLVGTLRPTWLVDTLAGAGWAIVAVSYFALFWSATGQTPGARIVGVRIVTAAGVAPPFWRAVVRVFGLALAIVPCFAGFLPALVDGRRRALQDFMAGTQVVYERETAV
jgi:uncharacterized RDD family membrane protein YckC